MKKQKVIIVALDGMKGKEAINIAKDLEGLVWGFKINDILFENKNIIKKLKRYGNVFADAKLYDIPNTVGNSVKRLATAGADIITVHTSGGNEMLQVAKANAGKSKIIGVTVLTSFKDGNKTKIKKLINDAIKAKLDGIVCSGHELGVISKINNSKKLLKIIPGIRPVWYKKKDDQKRIMTPKEAVGLGADYLVIGRPITSSKDVKAAVEKILLELTS